MAVSCGSQEPYSSPSRVFWIVDDGTSHAGQASIDRMREAWPNAALVHLPIHASWLNQVETYFSILQRKAIATGDFAVLDDPALWMLAFQTRYNGPPNRSTGRTPVMTSTATSDFDAPVSSRPAESIR